MGGGKRRNKIGRPKMKGKLTLFCSLLLVVTSLTGQTSEESFTRSLNNINQSALKAQLGFLASEWTEGREAGKKGEYLAADYIASILQLYGVKPGGDISRGRISSIAPGSTGKSYFQNFFLIKNIPGEEQVMKVRTSDGKTVRTISFTRNIDYSTGYTEQDIEIEAPVVFAGYGFKNEKLKCDDLSKLDLKGKFLLRISGSPGFASTQLSPSELAASSRETEAIARKMGAAGIIEFDPNSTIVGPQPVNEFLNMSPSEENPANGRPWTDYSLPDKNSQDNFQRIYISGKTANEILKGTGFVTEEYIKKSESKIVSTLPELRDRTIYLKTTVKRETVRVRNVIGVIEGIDPDQVIVLGAHYDHLGIVNGYTWNGADDNGSGTVGVMTIAKAIMETGIKPEKTVIIALWTAEEEGLLGSRYYVENLPYPLKNIRLNVNLDMISRYITDSDPKKVTMIYSESFPGFRTITEQNIKKYRIDLIVDFQPSKDPPGGSDHRSFVAKGIPVMRFKPGHREQYHTPADEISTVNWDIMEKIVKISFANIWELANSDW